MISIIVPAYNVEEYVSDCLESVVRQTYQDYELIFVDDGSTDDTLSIAQRYSSRDARFRVFPRSHEDVARARNRGLDHTRGEHITFLDADDTLHPHALESLFEAALLHQATIVIAGHYENQLVAPEVDLPRPLTAMTDRVMGPRTAVRALINGRLRTAVWASLYHRQLFSTLRFPNKPCSEDAFLMPELLTASVRTVAIRPCIYYYRRRLGSITLTMTPSRIHGPEARLDLYRVCRESYPPGKLRAVAMAGTINSVWTLALHVVEQAAPITSWRRRIFTVLPRERLARFCCHPLVSSRARIVGALLLMGLRPNAWISRRLRSVNHLLRRMPAR